jgi:hypothetical protein
MFHRKIPLLGYCKDNCLSDFDQFWAKNGGFRNIGLEEKSPKSDQNTDHWMLDEAFRHGFKIKLGAFRMSQRKKYLGSML